MADQVTRPLCGLHPVSNDYCPTLLTEIPPGLLSGGPGGGVHVVRAGAARLRRRVQPPLPHHHRARRRPGLRPDPDSVNGIWLGDDPVQIRPGKTRTAALLVRLRLGLHLSTTIGA